MEKIQFRIWLAGKFCYWGFFKGVFRGIPSDTEEPISLYEAEKRSQQYTGEKDKNNKKIFAGDVVRWYKEFDWIISGCKNFEYALFQVVFEQGAFWLKIIDDDYDCDRNNRLVRNACEEEWGDYKVPICEIVGNIHDNPELLIIKED